MSLLVWLPLNGTLENRGVSPAKFSLVTTGGGVATASNGKTTPGCYTRSTKNTISHITSDIDFTLPRDVSMACWCKLTDFGTSDSANGIITQHGHKTGGLGITMKYIGATDYRMSINSGLYGDAGGGTNDRTYHTYYGNTNIYNEWHHLCVTYDAATKQIKMYVDGALDRDPITVAGNSAVARPFRIFDWSTDHSGNASYRPPCSLNDVRLYDHCLSAKEVKILAQGLVAHYPLTAGGANNLLKNTSNPSSTSGLASVPGTCSVTYDDILGLNVFQSSTTATGETYIYSSRTAQVAQSTKYTFSCDVWVNDKVKSIETFWLSDTEADKKTGGGYVNVTSASQSIPVRNQWFHLSWTFTTKANDYTGYIRFDNNGSSTSGEAAIMKLANLKLERGPKDTGYSLHITEGNSSVADDCSGYGWNGTSEGTFQFDSDAPRLGTCLIFDGSTNRINLPILNLMKTLLNKQSTINFWVNEADTTSRSVYFGGYSGSNYNIEMEGAKFRVYWSGSPDFYCAANTVSNNTWTMFTVVTDVKTGIKVYKNGTLLDSKNQTLTDITTGFTRDTFCIGADSRSGVTMFEGKMSDFRIYCTALSADDIATLYKAAGSVAKNGALLVHKFIENPTVKASIKRNGLYTAGGYSETGPIADMPLKMMSDGSAWARVFYHKNKAGTVLFTSYDEVMHTTSENKFSRLSDLPSFIGTDGKYEFMLTYPERHPGQYNRWKQSYTPQATWMGNSDGTLNVTGYEAIHIDWTSSYWGGLGRQNESTTSISSTFIDGSIGHSNWFYAIGASSVHDGGIPGPSSGVQETELWVRFDTSIYPKKLNIMKERFISSSLLQEI